MNKMVGLAVIVSIVLISATFGNPAAGKGLGEPGMVWRLDLTKEQKENITAKEDVMQKEILLLNKSIRSRRVELNAQLSADKPDNSKINGLIDNISKDMAEIQKKKIFFMLWMREQLTPEQKQKLLSLLKNRQETGTGSEETGGF